jgi:hypothetical protein
MIQTSDKGVGLNFSNEQKKIRDWDRVWLQRERVKQF